MLHIHEIYHYVFGDTQLRCTVHELHDIFHRLAIRFATITKHRPIANHFDTKYITHSERTKEDIHVSLQIDITCGRESGIGQTYVYGSQA